MRFGYSYFLFLEVLPLLVFVISMILFKKRVKALSEKFDIKLIERYRETDIKKQYLYRNLFISIALFLLILSLARPQIGIKKVTINQPLKNIYFAIDLSSSMSAKDVNPSRIERAKLDVLSVINTLQNEKVGLIFFSNNAFLQSPATTDYDIIINILQALSDEITINTKTNIISPILLTKTLLTEKTRATKPGGNDANSTLLVILTDGEDNYEGFNKRLKRLKGMPFKLFFVVIGTPFGSPIPIKTEDGNIHYLKNSSGNLILTKLNTEKIRQIIKKTGGGYIVSKNPLYDTKKIKNSYKNLKSKIVKKEFSIKKELYQIPLALSLIFIILYLSIVFKNKEFFGETKE